MPTEITWGEHTIIYMTRADCGLPAVPRAGHKVPHSQFVGLVQHHTVMAVQDYDQDGIIHGDLDDIARFMRDLSKARPDLGPDVPYSFVLFYHPNPKVAILCEGRGFGYTGAHTSGYNSSRYAVSYAGNSNDTPTTDGMIAAVRWVGAQLADPTGARETFGHRDVKATACPGSSYYARLGECQPPFETPEEVIEMLYDMHAFVPNATKVSDRWPSWQADAVGLVLAHEGAPHFGDLPSLDVVPNKRIVAIVATPTGLGYWLIGADGGVFAFGDAPQMGSLGHLTLAEPIVTAELVEQRDINQLVLLLGAGDGGTFELRETAIERCAFQANEAARTAALGAIQDAEGALEVAAEQVGRI